MLSTALRAPVTGHVRAQRGRMKRLFQSILASVLALSPSARAQGPLSPEQQTLLAKAESTVRNYISNGREYPLFAMSVRSNGEVISTLASDEFTDKKEALVELLKSLIALARTGAIRANVLVTPMDPIPGYEQRPAVFDLEQRGAKRVIVVIPYKKGPSGWEFGAKEYRLAEPKLFAP
jgi:hypothetical protein